ncbi:MAG: hypothetical protein Q9201_004691 [Fulgogasparrea decipioides]
MAVIPSKHAHGKAGRRKLPQGGTQHRPQFKHRSNSGKNVRGVMPRRASPASKLQYNRRKKLMLEAKIKESTAAQLPKFQQIMTKIKKTIRNLLRKERRINEHKIRRELLKASDSATDPRRLAAWSKNIYQHQEVTRAAGYAFAVARLDHKDWGHLTIPSREDFTYFLGHFMRLEPYGLGWPRDRMETVPQRLLEYYDTQPMKRDSEEVAKAKVRMVREMILVGMLDREKDKGLKVSERELSEAWLGIARSPTGTLNMFPVPVNAKTWKEKNILWEGVEDWTTVKLHQLPLRIDSDNVRLSEQQENEGVGKGDTEDQDEDMGV